jgi:hypothetical protein
MTRGPWSVEAVSDAVRIIARIPSSDGLTRKPGGKKIILARLNPPQISEQETWENAYAMHAAPEMLDALRAIRKIGYDSQESRTREALLKCIDIAEMAIGAAESTSAAPAARPSGGAK